MMERRTERLSIRCTPEEKAIIVKESGGNISEWVLQCCLTEYASPELAALAQNAADALEALRKYLDRYKTPSP